MPPAQTRRKRETTEPVIEIPPVRAAELFVQAVLAHQAGAIADAEILYRKIILADPAHAEAWSNLGLSLTTRGAHAEAVQACATAIALRGDYADAHLNLITALSALGLYEEVVAIYRSAIALLPARQDLACNLGLVLEALGRPEAAVEAYRAVLRLDPGHTTAGLNAGRLLNAAGRLEEAVAIYEAAVAVRPDFVEALSNLGTGRAALGRFTEAADAGGRAFALRPDIREVACNFGVALQQSGRLAEAVDVYRHAIAIDPTYASPHANLGVALQDLLRFDEAVTALDTAIALDPAFHTAVVEAIKVRRHICDWSRFAEDQATLFGLLAAKRDVVFMLLLMSFASTPSQQFDCARQSMARLNAMPRMTPAPDPGPSGPLRIGYLSHDFREHPVGRLLPELFGRHDRAAVRVTAYSLGPDDPGAVRQAIRASVDRFIDLHDLSDREAAARIAADGTDILVDLTGPTIGSRLAILAQRPAPVQVSFLGWPGTVGLDAIDYVVADRVLVRPGEENHYCEKVVRLPDCYQPSDGRRGTADRPVTRAHCGLPDKGFVFCSFNNTSKITPAAFACWMRLLHRVPGSVLWLYCKTPQTIANLTATAAAAGIAAERIVFAGHAPTDLYLSRFRVADLFLDSLPYNAGATCNDALWAGLPVLTCVGDTYVGRMAASMLATLGLPELVTTSLDEYEERAVALATRPRRLVALRRKLAKAQKASPLFDMTRFAHHLEAAYAAMYRRHRDGRPPDHIEVARLS